MAPILAALASLLATKGFDLLKILLAKATEKGIEKATEYLEKKSGIPLVDHEGKPAQLKDKEIEAIKQVVKDNQVELSKILLEQSKIDLETNKIAMEDTRDARYLHSTGIKEYAELVEKVGEDCASGLWLPANFIYLYAFMVTIFGFAFMMIVMFKDSLTDSQVNFIYFALGNVFGLITTITGFFFGNSFKKNSNS